MRSRSGFALLEAIIALAILGTAGLSLVALIRSGLEGERRTRGEEKLMASASRVLTAMALLTREDLDRRLGTHAVGEFSVEVQRPEQALYRLAIAAADRSSTELLVTPGSPAAADLREGAKVIVGIQTPVANAAKAGGGGPRLPF